MGTGKLDDTQHGDGPPNRAIGPTDTVDFDPQSPAGMVADGREEFTEILEAAANDFYKKTGFVITHCTLQYHVQRSGRRAANVKAYALNVEVQLPEDMI